MTNIVTIDIENSPNLAYVWGKYEQNVIAFEREWNMLSFAYKWFGEKKVKSYSLPDFKGYGKDKHNDTYLVAKLWEVLDEADIVIGHNVDRFDIRKTNARFLAAGMEPPSSYQTIDTYKIAKKYFFLNSNKLSDLSKYLGIGEKLSTGGFDLWLGCMVGDKKSWRSMVKYNKQDVLLTEKVYLKLRAWINPHPNLNVVDERLGACPTCTSTKLQKRGFSFTRVSKIQRFQCTSCGAWSRGKPIRTNVEIR